MWPTFYRCVIGKKILILERKTGNSGTSARVPTNILRRPHGAIRR